EIIKIRAHEEGVELEEEALNELVRLGVERSLRYAVQLLAPAKIVAERHGGKVTKKDVEYVSRLFISTNESARYLKEYEDKFLR
ncbi:MAG: TATA box-binding protein, partial [Thermofilaceae archaeon]